jgi:hypothetical protein
MILTLDNLAARYHCLPSEALARSTTFDLYVLDIGARWSNYQHEKSNGKSSVKKEPTQDEMLAMIQRVKEQQQ